MDSKVVNKAIRENIRPILKEAGFSKFTARNAWRYRGEIIEVVNFQFFNSNLAESVGCTTYSFSINLGSYFKWKERMPWYRLNANNKILDTPQEYSCDLRGFLQKNLDQHNLFHPYQEYNGKDRKNVWYILEDGTNLIESVESAALSIKTEALPWFNQISNLDALLPMLLKEKPNDDQLSVETWIFSPKSFSGGETAALVAIKIGQINAAKKIYEDIIKSYESNSKISDASSIIDDCKTRISLLDKIK